MTLTPDPRGLQREFSITLSDQEAEGAWVRLVPGAVLQGSFGLKVEIVRVSRDRRELVVREL